MSNIDKTITLNFQAKVNDSINDMEHLSKSLGSVNQKLTGYSNTKFGTTIRTIGKEANKTYKYIYKLSKATGELTLVSKNAMSIKDSFTGVLGSIKKIGIALGTIKVAIKTAQKVFEFMHKFVNYSIQGSEALNLFNVAYGNIQKNGETTFTKLGKQADEFQKKLMTNFGANGITSRTYQALYQTMGTAGGLSEEIASIMSENTTKLVYDIASLYNKQEEDVAANLRSGVYAGQSKVLYQYGIDVTETGMDQYLDVLKQKYTELGDISVNQMTRSEKAILRYLVTLKQTEKAHGDYANTIESPANQLRMLKAEITNAGVALGNLFVKPYQKFLQLANGIVRTVRYIAEAIASMFGIKAESYNTSIASVTDEWEDQEDAIDGASKAAAAYKRQLLGFDQINNISEPKDSGTGANTGMNDIWGQILEDIGSYDNALDSVKAKAEKIAETIMGWLGFTRDAETGTWEFSSNLGGIIDILETVYEIVVRIIEWAADLYNNYLKEPLSQIIDSILSIISCVNKLWKIVEPIILKIVDVVLNILTPVIAGVVNIIKDVIQIIQGIIEFIVGVFTGDWSKAWDGIKNIFSGAWNGIKNIFETVIGILKSIFKGFIEIITELIKGIGTVFSNVWNTLTTGAKKAWEGIKSVFGGIADWFGNVFSKAWQKVKDVFSAGGKVFDGIKEGIADVFKTVVNVLIKGINVVIAAPFKTINGMLNTIHDIEILGVEPFSKLWKRNPLSVPQIPTFATGGFPEDGMFFANHGELVGKFSNGKTAVANNAQITEGIRQAVLSGMSEAMSNSGGAKFEFTVGEGIIVKKCINGINEITMNTGESPLLG